MAVEAQQRHATGAGALLNGGHRLPDTAAHAEMDDWPPA